MDEFIAQIGRRYTRLAEGQGLHVQYSASTHVTLYGGCGATGAGARELARQRDSSHQCRRKRDARCAAWEAVHFTVRDTGTGIPEAEIPRLFERFYQIDRARSDHGRHVGLGLAIVREIVDAHHGTIDVVSTLGQGTTVSVNIPLNTSNWGRTEVWHGTEGRLGERRASDRRPVVIGVGGR